MATVHEPSTIHRYRELLEAHVLPTLGGRQVKALQPLELQALYDQLLMLRYPLGPRAAEKGAVRLLR